MPDVVLFPDASLRGGLNKSTDVALYPDSNLRVSRLFPLIAEGITYFGILKCWTGSIWIKTKLKVRIGTAWISKPLRYWDGSEWKEIDTKGA